MLMHTCVTMVTNPYCLKIQINHNPNHQTTQVRCEIDQINVQLVYLAEKHQALNISANIIEFVAVLMEFVQKLYINLYLRLFDL